jgi:NADH-quinone oxidoreductase subunit J
MIESILFYVIAAFIIFMALNMVLSSNIVHSSLFMAATFLGVAFVYVLLQADYMAVVQIMVYVGAISVLFVFGVMLTSRTDIEQSNNFNRYKIYGGIITAVFFFVLTRVILGANFVPVKIENAESTISAIAKLLLNDYSIAFEASSILLLVATIGAIVIGKGVKQSK